MAEIKLTPGGLVPDGCPVPLGRRGENGATQIVFDFSAWAEEFGAGAISLRLRRNGDGAAYPILLTVSGHTAVWAVSNIDTATAGRGLAQYSYTVGTTVVKTWVFPVTVAPSLAETGEAPDPYDDWLAQLTALAADAQQAALDAEAASEAVQDMGVEAEALEPGETPTVTKSVDPETGAVTLTFGIPAGVGGGAVESVNGQTGEVTLDASDVGALPDTATLDDIPDGGSYARATPAQLEQIATNAGNIAALDGRVDGIEAVIPSAASTQNQLADKAFVTDSITQQTAIYRGSYATKSALLAVAWQTSNPGAAYYVSNNDYAVVLADESQDGGCWRYIYVTGTGWTAQYEINETPLTQAQLDALNSGATAAIISSIGDKLNKTGDGSDVTVAFWAAQSRDALASGSKLSVLFSCVAKWLGDLGTAAFRAATATLEAGSTALIEAGAVYTALAGKYVKPSGGIPASDLAAAVQTSLGKANSAATMSSIASTEATSIASRAYAVGERFWLDGVLCIVTSDIASGGTITVGTNCRVDVLGEDVSELKNALNIVDENAFGLLAARAEQGFINSSGAFFSHNKYRTTGYIPVVTGQEFTYYMPYVTTTPIIAFYYSKTESSFDSTKSVNGINGNTSGTYTASANGYVRFCYHITKTNGYVIFNENIPDNVNNTLNAKVALYTPLAEYANAVKNASDTEHNVFGVLATPSENGYVKSTGEFASNNNYRTTKLIHIYNGQSFSYKLSNATALPVISYYANESEASFDSAKSVNGINGYVEGTYTATADGFLRFTYYASKPNVHIYFTTSIPDNVKKYVDEHVAPNNGVRKMKILFMGDSIFGNDGEIPAAVATLSGAICINGAFGGTRVSVRSGEDNWKYFDGVNIITALTTQTWTDQDAAAEILATNSQWVTDRLATLKAVDMSEIDLIIMDWGTNDYTGSVSLADIETAYSTVIGLLQTAFPALRILITTPIWRYWDNTDSDTRVYNDATLKQIASGIETTMHDLRISVLNTYQNMPLSLATASTYFDSGDKTHLNLAGNTVYAHLLNGKIQSIY